MTRTGPIASPCCGSWQPRDLWFLFGFLGFPTAFFPEILLCFSSVSSLDKEEETLHVVSRFRGGGNLLHTCIKEGHLPTLRLLLDHFTVESQPRTRWRALAEPLRPVGKYKCSAFHRAVYDGRPDCLKELVDWARHHGHDITQLRNVEESDILGAQRGLTCLELSEQEGNLACYNILAPLFNVPAKDSGADANPREARMAERLLPRVELAADEQTLQAHPMNPESLNWEAVLVAISGLKVKESSARDPHQMVIRLQNLSLDDDASEQLADQILGEAKGMAALEANLCTWKTDKTALSFLAAVVKRLDGESSEHLPPRMPRKVDISSPTAEDLPVEEESSVDEQACTLLHQFVGSCGKWPEFLGARNGLISRKQGLRVAQRDAQSHAATVAAIYATRVNAFLGYIPGDLEDIPNPEPWNPRP